MGNSSMIINGEIMETVKELTKNIHIRAVNSAVHDRSVRRGHTDLQARILGGRTSDVTALGKIMTPRLSDLQDLNALHGANEAAKYVRSAIVNGKLILLVTDYDADGVTSASVLYKALTAVFNVPAHLVKVIINERAFGNGVNDTLVTDIKKVHDETPIGIMITADHGSSDEVRIKELEDYDIPVCITDHHSLPESGMPKSATCFVNPQRPDNTFDQRVSGCAVAYLLMCALGELYTPKGVDDIRVGLKSLLPIVAISTIADSMKMDSVTNRAIVRTGLREMNTLKDPVWQVTKKLLNIPSLIDETTIGFLIAPNINAAGRMGSARLAFNYLTAPTYETATVALEVLRELNNERKDIQGKMLKASEDQLSTIDTSKSFTLALYLTFGFGLQGIVSSNIGEKYGKPIVTFIRIDNELHGSARSIVPTFNMLQAFKAIAELDKDMFVRFGGHKGAAGCEIRVGSEDRFRELFDVVAKEQMGDSIPKPIYHVDGPIGDGNLNASILKEISAIGPYGLGWTKPTFVDMFTIDRVRGVGVGQVHLSMTLKNGKGEKFNAFFFNGKTIAPSLLTVDVDTPMHIVYSPDVNAFNGMITLQLNVKYGSKVL